MNQELILYNVKVGRDLRGPMSISLAFRGENSAQRCAMATSRSHRENLSLTPYLASFPFNLVTTPISGLFISLVPDDSLKLQASKTSKYSRQTYPQKLNPTRMSQHCTLLVQVELFQSLLVASRGERHHEQSQQTVVRVMPPPSHQAERYVTPRSLCFCHVLYLKCVPELF